MFCTNTTFHQNGRWHVFNTWNRPWVLGSLHKKRQRLCCFYLLCASSLDVYACSSPWLTGLGVAAAAYRTAANNQPGCWDSWSDSSTERIFKFYTDKRSPGCMCNQLLADCARSSSYLSHSWWLGTLTWSPQFVSADLRFSSLSLTYIYMIRAHIRRCLQYCAWITQDH